MSIRHGCVCVCALLKMLHRYSGVFCVLFGRCSFLFFHLKFNFKQFINYGAAVVVVAAGFILVRNWMRVFVNMWSFIIINTKCCARLRLAYANYYSIYHFDMFTFFIYSGRMRCITKRMKILSVHGFNRCTFIRHFFVLVSLCFSWPM